MKTQIVFPKSETVIAKEKAVAEAQPKAVPRLLFVDNLRIYLTILVILHHLIIIYSGSGGWIWKEGREDVITNALGSWFTSVNHSYFMGLFLLVAAYFVPGSYDRKGATRFLKDRLIRLGIPLVVYSWIVRPLFLYWKLTRYEFLQAPFLNWYSNRYFKDHGLIGGGPLWFIEALLVFSALYAVWRLIFRFRPNQRPEQARFPGSISIALFAICIAVASFFVRLWFPTDSAFEPLNFQLADFSQYIALFVIGLIAYRNNWFSALPDSTGRRWLLIALLLILIYPPMAIFGGAVEDSMPFKGGWHWQALLAVLWQSFLCLSMCIGLVYLFRRYLDRQTSLAGFLSRNAYTAYLIHEPVITLAALSVVGITLYPLLKFGLMALVIVPIIFWLSNLIRWLPYTQRVL